MFPTLDVQLTREYFMRERDSVLAQLDNIERLLGISPRTAELRKVAKRERMELQLEKERESKEI